MDKIELLAYLSRRIRRERRIRLLVGLVIILLGVSFIYKTFGQSPLFTIFCMGFVIFGIKLIYDTIQLPPIAQAKSLRNIATSSRQIVWVYTISKDLMPFGLQVFSQGRLVIKYLDGDESIIVVHEDLLVTISKQLENLVPHASIGYSDEKMQWFLASPSLLYVD